jgi:hypothetical protein
MATATKPIIYERSEPHLESVTEVVVAGRRMLYEVAIRGMDPDLFELARKACRSPQAVVDRYAELHYLRHGEEWHGYAVW